MHSFVPTGKKRDTFRGAATLRAFDYLKGIEKFEGVVNHLSTEVVDSNHRNFPMVDLIDTPGLTDGKLQYAFPVNDIIAWLADRVDLIFVFFDPHGQATCERTMNIVKQLHQQKSNKGTFGSEYIDIYLFILMYGRSAVQALDSGD